MDILGKAKKIIWTFFPPESTVERALRTQYHRLSSTRLYTDWKIRQSKKSYFSWLRRQRMQLSCEENSLNFKSLFSFFLSANILDINSCLETIRSIQSQTVENWELILFSAKSTAEKGEIDQLIGHDARIRLIAEEDIHLRRFLELAKGDYFICCSPGDTFEKELIYELVKKIAADPAAEILYTDVDLKNDETGQPQAFFKPETYSPELHLSVNYLSSAFVKKASAPDQIDKLTPGFDFLLQEWELMFLLCEKHSKLTRIPLVLVHQFRPLVKNGDQERALFEGHLHRVGISSSLQIIKEKEIHVRWEYHEPSVSIVIPSKNHSPALRKLLDSLFTLTTYRNFEVVIVDNNSTDSEVLSYYARVTKEHPVKIIPFNETFNYSKAINLGASASSSEILLFLNNDMEVISPDWLTELVQWVMDPGIGIVGGKLLYDNDTIQHAGIIIGLQGFVGHLYLHAPDHYFGLLGSVDWYRNLNAVTGACQMMRRSVFDELGGYDEKFGLVFNDVDFCLRAIKKGYRNLYTPFAELRHFEGKSRGFSTPRLDLIRGYDVLNEWISKEDPYFSPNLTYTPIPLCQFNNNEINHRLEKINERKKYLLK
jgi:GT2 family glycosyltransferase